MVVETTGAAGNPVYAYAAGGRTLRTIMSKAVQAIGISSLIVQYCPNSKTELVTSISARKRPPQRQTRSHSDTELYRCERAM